MSRRRSKTSGSITAIVGLIFLLLILSNCGKKISSTDKQATQFVRDTNHEIYKTNHWETYHANATSVEETIERKRVIATVTAIYERTIKPTLDYEATHEKFVTEIKQQQTVENILTLFAK